MQNGKSIAIFGGSFNPPLNSHISLAKEIINTIESIEKIIFVPVSTKYQKEELEEDKHRYNMLNLICKKEKKFEVSNIELKADSQLYTIQTLDIFKEQYKEYKIHFIMGADNLKEIETWKAPERILSEYKIIALERGEESLKEVIQNNELLYKYRDSIILIGNNKIGLCSTQIRNMIKNKENISQFIDKDVLNYIIKNNLYV